MDKIKLTEREEELYQKLIALGDVDELPRGLLDAYTDVKTVVIPRNIHGLRGSCVFSDMKELEKLYLEKGCLDRKSGSDLFTGCKKLKEVHAASVRELMFRYDGFGHPYFKKVKVYIGDKSVTPVVLTYQQGFSFGRILKEISIIGKNCLINRRDCVSQKIVETATKTLSPDEYYEFVDIILSGAKSLSDRNNVETVPFVYDAGHDLWQYCLFEEITGEAVGLLFSNKYAEHRIRDFLEKIVSSATFISYAPSDKAADQCSAAKALESFIEQLN